MPQPSQNNQNPLVVLPAVKSKRFQTKEEEIAFKSGLASRLMSLLIQNDSLIDMNAKYEYSAVQAIDFI